MPKRTAARAFRFRSIRRARCSWSFAQTADSDHLVAVKHPEINPRGDGPAFDLTLAEDGKLQVQAWHLAWSDRKRLPANPMRSRPAIFQNP